MKRVISIILAIVLSVVSFSVVSVAEDTPSVEFYVKQVTVNKTTLKVQVRVAVSDDTEVNSFGIYVSYDDTVLKLNNCSFNDEGGIVSDIGGLSVTSQDIDDVPYRLLWAGGVANIEAGDYLFASLTFDIIASFIPDGAVIYIAEDIDNPVSDYDGNAVESTFDKEVFEIPHKTITIVPPEKDTIVRIWDDLDLSLAGIKVVWLGTNNRPGVVAVTEDMISGFDGTKYGSQKVTITYEDVEGFFTVNVVAKPGDADRSGSVNLNDVSLMMKHIAEWSPDTEIDTIAANVDGKTDVNLSDVSLVMKYIAKWDVTLK